LPEVYGAQLVPIDVVRQRLEAELDPGRVARFSEAVEKARAFDDENQDRRNYWGELSIWSERRLAELIRQGQEQGLIASPGRPQKSGTVPLLSLSQILGVPSGQARDRSRRAQRLLDQPESEVTVYLSRQKSLGEVISKAGVIRYCTGTEKAGRAAHVSANSGVPEWYTPPEYLEAAREVMGGIDLDPASSEIAQRNVRASTFYTLEDDGLAHDWRGRVWLNPPYTAGTVERFVAKLCSHYKAGDVTAAILLVNNATETKWFQKAGRLAADVCFPAGRIRFLDESLSPVGAPLQGQSFLYFGENWNSFRFRFERFGLCPPGRRKRPGTGQGGPRPWPRRLTARPRRPTTC
jgi:ParB family chromosome partitioning protein